MLDVYDKTPFTFTEDEIHLIGSLDVDWARADAGVGRLSLKLRVSVTTLSDAEALAWVVRGAPAIGCTAAYGLAVEALRLQHLAPPEFFARMDQAAALLAASRPTAVNLFWAIARMRRCLQDAASATPAAIDAFLRRASALGVDPE